MATPIIQSIRAQRKAYGTGPPLRSLSVD